MIISRLSGGLGNQMFQYAFGKFLAHKHGTALLLDISALGRANQANHDVLRQLDLVDVFDVKGFSIANEWTLGKYERSRFWRLNALQTRIGHLLGRSLPLVIERQKSFDPEMCHAPNNSYLHGYWQSEQYFAPIAPQLRQEFTFKRPLQGQSAALAQAIAQPARGRRAVCINVRRGDFVNNPKSAAYHGFVGEDYYRRASERLAEALAQQGGQPYGYVFSDEPNWCKANLPLAFPFEVVGHEHKGHKFADYLQLMTFCQHFIIPNSTFGWWAAWLCKQPHKTVIAPQQWYAQPADNADTRGLVPEGWLRV